MFSSPPTCGSCSPPSETCRLSAQPAGCTGHLGYSPVGWWRLAIAGWPTGRKTSCGQTASRASAASGEPLAPCAARPPRRRCPAAWRPTRCPPCPPGRYAAAPTAVSGWRWRDPGACLPAGAAGLTPCAAALLAAGQEPERIHVSLDFKSICFFWQHWIYSVINIIILHRCMFLPLPGWQVAVLPGTRGWPRWPRVLPAPAQ